MLRWTKDLRREMSAGERDVFRKSRTKIACWLAIEENWYSSITYNMV